MKTLILLLCCVLFSSPVGAQKVGRKYPWVKIETLNKATSDTVRLKAYVFDIYVCPPCPEGMQCKPCMENHLTVVEGKFTDPQKVSLNSRLRIFSDHPDSLKIGKRYIFTISFSGKPVRFSDHVRLLSFTPF